MKRISMLLTLSLLIAAFSGFSYAANDVIKVTIDGKLVKFDVPPQSVNGRTLVPFRDIFEAMAADVKWNASTKTAVGTRGEVEVKLVIGSTTAQVNGKDLTLDVPPAIIDGRTFVPVRFIGESMGAMVNWDDNTKTVAITEPSAKVNVKEQTLYADNSTGIYSGETQNSKPHGMGSFQYYSANTHNAKEYNGEFRYAKLHGDGVLIFNNGDQYTGSFVNNKFHGNGTLICANGDRYVGEWKYDVKHGQGTMTWANGNKYVGSWVNGKEEGEGTKTYANGDVYTGTWKEGKFHGQGTKTWANGDKYVGEWKENLFHGQGTMTWANGDKYEGSWDNGKKHGKGVFTHEDGKVEKGYWQYDQLVDSDTDWNF
ncbi:MAG: stalk domain-containing protein [Bacillota bacterium]